MYTALVDLDGTLADVSEFEFFVQGNSRNFDAFHRASMRAPVNPLLLSVLKSLHQLGIEVRIVTGRTERWREATEFWLQTRGVPYEEMLMRPTIYSLPDLQLKSEFLVKIRQYSEPIIAFDDRPEILNLWQSNGIPTVYVAGTMNQFGNLIRGNDG